MTSLDVHASGTDTIARLRSETSALESELNLAESKKVYFIFDLKEGKVFLKVRGMTLKEMPAGMVMTWNPAVSGQPFTLAEKNVFIKPKRGKIIPKTQDAGTDTASVTETPPQVDALELEDMPDRFGLILDKGTVIYIRHQSDGLIGRFKGFLDRSAWYLTRPAMTTWNFIRGRSYSAIYLALSETDARSIYWSFPDGNQCLVRLP